MPLRVEVIPLREAVIGVDNLEDLLNQQLGQLGFAGDMIREGSDYPAQLPTVSGYIRTGTLGRGWRLGSQRRGASLAVTVDNPTTYARRVQGPRRGFGPRPHQVPAMRMRGWRSIEVMVARVWPEHRDVIINLLQQRDRRLRRRRIR